MTCDGWNPHLRPHTYRATLMHSCFAAKRTNLVDDSEAYLTDTVGWHKRIFASRTYSDGLNEFVPPTWWISNPGERLLICPTITHFISTAPSMPSQQLRLVWAWPQPGQPTSIHGLAFRAWIYCSHWKIVKRRWFFLPKQSPNSSSLRQLLLMIPKHGVSSRLSHSSFIRIRE